MIYRHIVPSSFRSAIGPGLMSGGFAAKVAFFLIRRGVRYVPVTYTGVALVNYFKFVWFTRPDPVPVPTSSHRVESRRDLAPLAGR